MSSTDAAEDTENLEVEQDQYLIFTCAGQEFAIQGMRVQEISAPLNVTKIPGTPPHLEGIANLRGRLVSVVDFRRKFGFEAHAHDEDTRIVLAEYDGYPIGLTVDSVEEVIRIPDDKVQKLPESVGTPISREFITGMGVLEGRIIILLDVNRLLSGSAVPESMPIAAAMLQPEAGKPATVT